MFFISHMKTILFFFIYLVLLYILLNNFSTSRNVYNIKRNNFSDSQEFLNNELVNVSVLINDIQRIKNFEEEDFYNNNNLGIKHNILCNTNPSIIIAPYCYRFKTDSLPIDFYMSESNIRQQFSEFQPKRKYIDSYYLTKFKSNIGERIYENIKIVFNVLITKNEKFQKKYIF